MTFRLYQLALQLAILGGLSVVLSVCGCRRSCPPAKPAPIVEPLPEIRIVQTFAACLASAPPAPATYAPVSSADAPPAACLSRGPDALVCFDPKNAAELERRVADLETWADAAWARCKSPQPESEASP